MWRLQLSRASFRPHSFLPNSSPLTLLFFILRHSSYSFLECRRRGATSRLGRRFGSKGGGHHAGDCAGSRRLPPQRPARALPRPGPYAPNLRRATGRRGWGKREAERRGSKDRSSLRRPKPMRDEKGGEEGDPLMERAFG